MIKNENLSTESVKNARNNYEHRNHMTYKMIETAAATTTTNDDKDAKEKALF